MKHKPLTDKKVKKLTKEAGEIIKRLDKRKRGSKEEIYGMAKAVLYLLAEIGHRQWNDYTTLSLGIKPEDDSGTYEYLKQW